MLRIPGLLCSIIWGTLLGAILLLGYIGYYSLEWVKENEDAEPQLYTDDAITGAKVSIYSNSFTVKDYSNWWFKISFFFAVVWIYNICVGWDYFSYNMLPKEKHSIEHRYCKRSSPLCSGNAYDYLFPRHPVSCSNWFHRCMVNLCNLPRISWRSKYNRVQ